MSQLTTIRTCLALPWLLAIAACQQDATIASNCADRECSHSDALLTLNGSVTITSDRDDAELKPAVAFFNAEESEFHVVDVDAEGEFPSRFTIRVYEAPPEQSLVTAPSGRLWALGYLTAVAEDHPQLVRFSRSTGGSGGCWDTPGCDGAEECAPPQWTPERPCQVEDTRCNAAGDACYHETRSCPALDSAASDCEVVASEGDSELRQDPWAALAGLSENMVLIYLVDPLHADEPAARAFDSVELDAGYHLMRLAEPTAQEREARDACAADARDLVAERFNAEHDTDFTGDQIPGGLSCASNTNVDCASLDALRATLDQRLLQAQAELACPPAGVALHEIDVAGAGDDGISVRIGENLSPLGTPYGGAPPSLSAPPPPPDVPVPPASE